MSSTSHHFWQLHPNYNPGYYQAPPNYYIARNMADPRWNDNIEDPYLRDFYATAMNYNYYQPVIGYIDDHLPFIVSTNPQSRYTYNGQSSFDYIDDPYMWEDDFHQSIGEFVDDVYVTNEREFIDHHRAQTNNYYVSRNIGDHYFAPHNSAFTIPDQTYDEQSSFDHIGDSYLWGDVYNQPTGEFVNSVYATTESGFNDDANDYVDYLQRLLENLVTYVEGNEEEEITEEVIGKLMKTRSHCSTDDGEEICVICQCEYENDETIGTLECRHEYHAGCIKEWLMKGNRSCPICRSSVLPS